MRRATKIFLGAGALAYVAWDIYVYAYDVQHTISRVLQKWGMLYASIPLALSTIVGHAFGHWRQDQREWTIYVMTSIGIATLSLDIVRQGWWYYGNASTDIVCVAGYLIGKYLWPQPKPKPIAETA